MLDSSHFYLIRKRWMATNNLCSTDPFFHGLLWWSWCVVNDFRKTNMVNMSRKKANGERDTLLTVPEKLRTLNMKFVSTPLIEQNSCVMTYSISHFFFTINTAKYIQCAMHTVPQILISISANFLYQLFNLSSRYSILENNGPFLNKHYVITFASKEGNILKRQLRS